MHKKSRYMSGIFYIVKANFTMGKYLTQHSW